MPTRLNSITQGTTMGISFLTLTGDDTRGAPIVSYFLEMDSTNNGAGPFTEIGGYTADSFLTQYCITNLVSGQY